MNEDKPSFYDPDGNSDLAVVTRMRKGGVIKALTWESRKLKLEVCRLLSEFNGVQTPVWWFALAPSVVILSPIMLLSRTYYRYKNAMRRYAGRWNNARR